MLAATDRNASTEWIWKPSAGKVADALDRDVEVAAAVSTSGGKRLEFLLSTDAFEVVAWREVGSSALAYPPRNWFDGPRDLLPFLPFRVAGLPLAIGQE
ncbi:MAG: hypothetical protein LC623_09955, partial [Halobacteriales archaeon]|nr:hypothetical protein [Halobacteriales archaeon]